jgi:formamidopyrimidine-DNA glycosylase
LQQPPVTEAFTSSSEKTTKGDTTNVKAGDVNSQLRVAVVGVANERGHRRKAGLPCPVCGEDLKRVSYESHEVVYCPTCQTGGKVLADRRLSRLVK